MRQPLPTDMTDAQWERVCGMVLGSPSGRDPLREVVNALLYREQARIPCDFLPPGFPSPAVLREALDNWHFSGIWPRIQAAVRGQPIPLPPREDFHHEAAHGTDLDKLIAQTQLPSAAPGRAGRTGFRFRLARLARKVPGGILLVLPFRISIQFAQVVARRFSPHSRLPGVFKLAHRLTFGDMNYAAAVAVHTQVLALDPGNATTYLRRAYCQLKLNQLQEACADCWTMLGLPGIAREDRVMAYHVLSEAHTLGGDLDRGTGYGYLGRITLQQGDDAPWADEDGPRGPDEFAARIDTHRDLAELLINTRTDFAAAAELYHRVDAWRDRYAHWLATVPPNTLYLNEDWTRNIGHLALIDFLLKMDRLGWRRWDRMVMVTRSGAVANPVYVEYYQKYFEPLPAQTIPPAMRNLITAFAPRVAGLVTLPDGSERYIMEALGVIQEGWERAGHGPLLRLTPEDIAHGRQQLRKMGVPDGAWFVCLHVRSPGYHKETGADPQSHRNADIRSYRDAAREIVRRGGWVIRMGDRSMPPFPPTPGVIDYALSEFKNPRTDIFLCGAARFFIGVASGISHVPTTFGVPCLLTNWLSNALPVYSRNDIFIPKLLRSMRDGRLVSFEEYLAPATRLLSYSREKLRDNGLEVVENTTAELRDVVVEMLDQLDGTGVHSEGDSLVARFDSVARGQGLDGFSRIARSFAVRHRDLLPAPVRSAHVA